MRVCLVTSPRFNCRPDAKSLAPLGLASLAAVARQAGHEVHAVEGLLLGDPKRIAAEVAACRPDLIGTSTVTQDRLACLRTIRAMRQACPSAFLVVGGSHFTNSAVDALQHVPQIDAVVLGEGEQTFLELLEHLGDRGGLDGISGLAWRKGDGQVVVNDPRPLIQDLDSLPMPAWDLFGPQNYDQRATKIARTPAAGGQTLVTGVMTTRGCPQRCVFCANGVPTRVRYMSPAKAVDQMQWLQKTYGVTGLDILDDNFYASEKHVVGLCEEMLRRNLQLVWWAGMRLKNLDPQVLELMKRAGCRALSFGVETGTDEVLRAVRKNITAADMLAAMEVVARVGFERLGIFLIVGLPGETAESLDRTVEFLRRLQAIAGNKPFARESLIGALPLIFPGTELETMAREQGQLPADFSWNSPYLEPKRHLPLINHRYQTVPHFENRGFPLEALCRHVKRRHWGELSAGRRRRYRFAPVRKVLCKLGLK